MRLGDLDALKEQAKNILVGESINTVLGINLYKILEEIINNAPTVEVPENAVNCVLTMFGKCSYNKTGCSDCEIKDKIRKALSERTQGEWLNTSPYDDKGECSLCCYLSKKYYKFCPYCGAKMKGGAE